MSILAQLSKLKRSPKMAGIRKYTNLLYYDPNYASINVNNFDVIEVDGCRFRVTDQINAIQRVAGNEWFDKVRETDIVVDIGANIGAMTIPYAKIAKKVWAVEPLYYDDLEANVFLNGLDNVIVIPLGIGNRGSAEVVFGSRSDVVQIMPFNTLKDMVGAQIDFLKMDGEGCEWAIEPQELKGIRELRIEFHIDRDKVHQCRKMYGAYIEWMKSEGYEVHETRVDVGANPYYKESMEVRASLK